MIYTHKITPPKIDAGFHHTVSSQTKMSAAAAYYPGKRFHVASTAPIGQRLSGFESVKSGDWLVRSSIEDGGRWVVAHRIVEKTDKRVALIMRTYDARLGTSTVKRVLFRLRAFVEWDDASKTKRYKLENKSQGEFFCEFMTQEEFAALTAT